MVPAIPVLGLLLVLGALVGALWAMRDRLLQVRKDLRASKTRHSAILRALPDLMFVFSRDGVYVDFYAKDSNALYTQPEKFIGRRVRDVMPSELAHRFEDSFVRVFESDEPLVVEYSLEVGDGMRDFEARIVRSDDDMIVSIVRDVTEQKTSERSLKGSEAVLRATQLENQTLCGRLIAAQEAVSQRIARDLHDHLGQKLALLNLEVEALAAYGADQLGLEARVHDVSGLVEQIAVDVHNLSRELHPYQLSLLGLVDAIDGIVRDTSRQYGIVVDFRHRDVPRDIDDHVALCLHRVVQEALHNVVKHSGAKMVTVELTGGSAALELSVADQGCGFATDAPNLVGLGLVSMTERVKFIGGDIMICSSPGAGTRLDVRVPS